MATKLPLVLYNGKLKRIQVGDETPGQSEATVVQSTGLIDNSEARSIGVLVEEDTSEARSIGVLVEEDTSEAKSIGVLVEEDTSEARSIANIADNLGSEAYSYAVSLANSVDIGLVASIATVSDSIADLAEGKASNADSVAERAASLARVAVATSDISEATSIAILAEDEASEARSEAKSAAIIGSQGLSEALVASEEASEGRSEADLATATGVSEARSLAVLAEDEASEARSEADIVAATFSVYTIAASAAATPREGRCVYMTTTANTVALARADAESTMPIFGVILHDGDTSVNVQAMNGLITEVKVDSSAGPPAAGDDIFVSGLEAGKFTDVVPESGVLQWIGTSKTADSSANIDLNYDAKEGITL